MSSKKSLTLVILVCLMGATFGASVAQAQSVRYRIPVTVVDSGLQVKSDTKLFGLHPDATTCIDGTLKGFTDRWYESDVDTSDEFEVPPPAFGFDFRFLKFPSTACGTDAGPAWVEIHHFTDTTANDTFRLQVQAYGDGVVDTHYITVKMPSVMSAYADSLILKERVTGTGLGFNVNMTQQSSFTFKMGTGGFDTRKQFFLIIKGPKIPPGPPSITTVSPEMGEDTVSLTPAFQWLAVPNAKYYRFQLARDSLFTGSNLVRTDSLPGSATSLTQSTNLAQFTTYYWRVLVSNPYGVSYYQKPPLSFRTRTTQLSVTLVSPADNATGIPPSGATLLWNRASTAPGVTYHVQVASAANFAGGTIISDAALLTDTTFTTGALNSCVTYYWHVSATNEAGEGSFQVTPRSFRVSLATPAVPVLVSPPDGATNVSVTPTLSWTGDACSDSYRLAVARDAMFSDVVFNQIVASSPALVTPQLDDDNTFYWRVTAINAVDSSSPAAAFTFRTSLSAPPTPVLVSPANNEVAPLPVQFTWQSSRNATTYRLDISKTENFASLLFVDSTHADTSQTVASLQHCQTYFWRVRAKNPVGASAFTATRVVHIERDVPANPLLLDPPHGAPGVQETATLRWAPADSCINAYILHVSTNVNAAPPFYLEETLSATQRTIGPLTAFTKYYWRVMGLNEIGSSAGDTSSFLVSVTPPLPPTLFSPPNGAGGLSTMPTLMWDTSARATKYRLQVSYNAGFTLLAVNDSTITQPSTAQVSKQVGPLPNSTTFYWRVYAGNNVGSSEPSATYSFATLSPPASPTLISPSDGAVEVSVLPTLFWAIADGAVSYRLQVSRDPIFSLVVFDDSTITTTSRQIDVLLKSVTTYYWQVRGKNAAGNGDWSSIRSFTTQRTGVANWSVGISVCESGPACDTLFFGINPNGTYGIDPGLGEYELPPGSFGWFDARWVDNASPSRIGEGLRLDYHGFHNYSQVDTFKLKFQPGTGSYPMKVSWLRSYVATLADSMVISDEFGGAAVRARMDLVSSVTVTNSNISTLTIICYGAFPLDVKPPEIPELPRGFTLSQNYPNPFNPSTHLEFSTDQSAEIRVTVYDVLGREVARLARSMYTPGAYGLEWNGRNDEGFLMPSGVYYARMNAWTHASGDVENPPYVLMRKMIMMK
jgi:hypothetical protein